MKLHKLALTICICLALTACAMTNQERSADEWLSLAQSGLIARDHYTFSGQVSMGLEEGITFQPATFEGKVAGHQLMMLQVEKPVALYWSPAQMIEQLSRHYDSAKVLNYSKDETTGQRLVNLHITEQKSFATKRWSDTLKEEFTSVVMNANAKDEAQTHLLSEATAEFDEMVGTLSVYSEYILTVDSDNLIPIKLEEQSVFEYKRKGVPMKEFRQVNVRFLLN